LQNGSPKPLFDLLGVPLLARTLFTLQKAGITDAHVVLGHQAEAVRNAIESISRLTIRVHWLFNDEWTRPNGYSVLAAASVMDGPFVLTMCDHVFDPTIVERLFETPREPGEILLAVDRDIAGVADLDDATKVTLGTDGITRIGKDLESFDAVDTGVFLAEPTLFDGIREAALTRGEGSLSAGVQVLADAGHVRPADVTGLMWQDVDTLQHAAVAERKLMVTVRKVTDGPIAKRVNRPISGAISRRLVRTGVTPNQLTFANLFIGFLSAGLSAVGGYFAFLIAGVLFQVTSILDGADGEVAKLTFRSSKQGEWFDTVSDNVTYVACLLGLTIGATRHALPRFYSISGAVGLVMAVATFASLYTYLIRQKGSGSLLAVEYDFRTRTGPIARALQVGQYLTKRDVFAFGIMALAIIGQLPLVLPFFAGATIILFSLSIRANLALRPAPAPAQAAGGAVNAAAGQPGTISTPLAPGVTTLSWSTEREPSGVSEPAG